jgi:hypothetical protein
MIEKMPPGDIARGMQWLLPHLEKQISNLDKLPMVSRVMPYHVVFANLCTRVGLQRLFYSDCNVQCISKVFELVLKRILVYFTGNQRLIWKLPFLICPPKYAP